MSSNLSPDSSRPGLPWLELSPEELACLLQALGQKPYRAKQIFAGLHRLGLEDWAGFSNLPLALKHQLQASNGPPRLLRMNHAQKSLDGTVKMLLAAADGACWETVLIPMEGFYTQCLSSQTGCAMGCAFCCTGSLGVGRNLEAHEIIEQCYLGIKHCPSRVKNMVFMGMGEPMLNLDNILKAVDILCHELGQNFSRRRFTISTCGWVPGIQQLALEGHGLRLALSLNSADNEIRSQIMPVNKKYPLPELKKALLAYPLSPRDRITLEYIMINGLTDRPQDVKHLLRFCNGLKCKLNLIPFNPHTNSSFAPSPPSSLTAFQRSLLDKGLPTTIRLSKGQDIAAACGQLSARQHQ